MPLSENLFFLLDVARVDGMADDLYQDSASRVRELGKHEGTQIMRLIQIRKVFQIKAVLRIVFHLS